MKFLSKALRFEMLSKFSSRQESLLRNTLLSRYLRFHIYHRAYVSRGAVGASAPTLFETEGACTHAFLQIFGYFWMALWKTCRLGEKEV